MENFYSAYVRSINGDTFYFVKKYQMFPEYENVPRILESYAMHKDFKKACKIALVNDTAIQQQLIAELQFDNALPGLSNLHPAKAQIFKFRERARQINLPYLLRLAWLRKVS